MKVATSSLNGSLNSNGYVVLPERNTIGFILFLEKNPKFKSKLFALHGFIEYNGQFLQGLKESKDLDVFIPSYRSKTFKNAFSTAFVLGASAAGWQMATYDNDPDDLFVYSITTGFAAAVFLNLANCLFIPKSRGSISTTSLSKLFPAWLVDGLWQPVWLTTEDPFAHFGLYLLVGMLYLVTQGLMSDSISLALTYCKPHLVQYVPTTTWSTPLILAWGYWGFGYLMPSLLVSTTFPAKVFAAFLSSFIPVLAYGLVVDYAVVSKLNVDALEEAYKAFNSEPEKFESYIDVETSIPEEKEASPRPTPYISLMKNAYSFCSSWICRRCEKSATEHAIIPR